MKKFYNLALDLGTNSVGWAAIGGDYRIIKKGDRRLWGVVLYDEGSSAAERRVFRSARRRYERRRERVELLRSLLAQTMDEVDPAFFRRLDVSNLADKQVDPVTGRPNKYNLFDGPYTDKLFYKEYKTIYHLRDALTKREEKADIRLIYLALHHIVKYRGNFLHEEDAITISGSGVVKLLKEAVEVAREADLLPAVFDFDAEEFYRVLSDDKKSKSDKKKELVALCGKTDFSVGFVTLLCGSKLKKTELDKMFGAEENCEDGLQFGSEETEDQIEKCRAKLGEDCAALLEALSAAYTEHCFVNILGDGNTTISQAMIAKYNTHKEHLVLLKSLLRATPFYAEMFKSPRKNRTAKNNYAAYVRTSTKRTKYAKACTQEDFYKYVLDVLKQLPESEEKAKVRALIECETFMPRLNHVNNGAIPFQLNLNELVAILDRQEKYYPELKQNRDKIISLLTFRRPYSVGVLRGDFSWIDQKIEGKVYPWNFKEKVDIDAAGRNFIARMLSRDPFFPDEYVLPLQSITYQTYVTLNELNNLRYQGHPLDVKLKQAIFDNLYCKKVSVKKKDILAFLGRYYGRAIAPEDLNYADENVTANMKTYIDLKSLFGADFSTADVRLYDELVEYIAVFKDISARERMLKAVLKEKKPSLLKYVAQLLKKKYAGWGRYAYRTLREEKSTEVPARSVLDILYQTGDNMQQVLYAEQYGFAPRTVNRSAYAEARTYDALIEPLYADATVKKTVWQAYKIVREVIEIMGCDPEHIFVETTREANAKARKVNRKTKLDQLYKAVKGSVAEANAQGYYATCADALGEKTLEALSDERVYLYFVQMGKCMYTGQPLSLEHLFEYEVDHVLPRSYVKDDSLDNKVLVLRESNQRKRNYALTGEVIERMRPWWQFLCDHGFISRKKFDNLCRRDWNADVLSGFINRQLVETTQINKCMAEVIRRAFPQKEHFVLNVRAQLGSQLRHMMTEDRENKEDENSVVYGSFFKLRDLNDLHHAKDAYLAGVLGTFTYDYFPVWGQDGRARSLKRFIDDEDNALRSKWLLHERYGVILDMLRSGHYTPCDQNGEAISVDAAFGNICRQMDYNDIAVIKLKESWANSGFYNQNPVAAGEAKIPLRYVKDAEGNLTPLNPDIYGGYTGEQCAYFVGVAYPKGKKIETKLVGIPVQVATVARAEGDKGGAVIDAFVAERYQKDYPQAKVVGKPVYKNQLIEMKGHLVYIVADAEVANARQLVVDKRFARILYAIEKDSYTPKTTQWINEDGADFVRQYIEKLRRYYPLYHSIADKVEAFVESGFADLSPQNKGKYIRNLLLVTKAGSSRVDMPKEWNGGSGWGRLGGKSINVNQVTWYDASITGYYRNKK